MDRQVSEGLAPIEPTHEVGGQHGERPKGRERDHQRDKGQGGHHRTQVAAPEEAPGGHLKNDETQDRDEQGPSKNLRRSVRVDEDREDRCRPDQARVERGARRKTLPDLDAPHSVDSPRVGLVSCIAPIVARHLTAEVRTCALGWVEAGGTGAQSVEQHVAIGPAQ